MEHIRKIVREVLSVELSREEANGLFEKKFDGYEFIKWTRTGGLYRKEPGVIVKVTRDRSEYDNALRFIKRPHKNFVKYYHAEPWIKINGHDFFILEMEELKELDDAEWELVDLIQNSLGAQEYMLNDNKRYRFLNELKANPDWYEDYGTYKDAIKIVFDLYSMYKEADRRGFVLYDLRAINLGRTNDGRLVHFDIGNEY